MKSLTLKIAWRVTMRLQAWPNLVWCLLACRFYLVLDLSVNYCKDAWAGHYCSVCPQGTYSRIEGSFVIRSRYAKHPQIARIRPSHSNSCWFTLSLLLQEQRLARSASPAPSQQTEVCRYLQTPWPPLTWFALYPKRQWERIHAYDCIWAGFCCLSFPEQL